MPKVTVQTVSSGYVSGPIIDSNFTNVQTAMENTLSRDGTSPNQMEANIDMNGNRVTNLPDAVSTSEPATLGQLQAAQLAGAEVYDPSLDQTITGNYTFRGGEVNLEGETGGAGYRLTFYNPDAPVDEKYWFIAAESTLVPNSGNWQLRTWDDAQLGGGTVISVTRTGTQVDSITLAAESLIHSSTAGAFSVLDTNSNISGTQITDNSMNGSKLINGTVSTAKLSTTVTSAPTANTIALRDANGRTQVATPIAATDAANSSYVQNQVAAHAALTASGTHGAVSTAAANSIMFRDADGRSQIATPVNTTEITNKAYVDNADSAHAGLTAVGTHGSTTTATASRLVHRDAAGRAQVADPSAAADISTKNYVDTTLAAHVAAGDPHPTYTTTIEVNALALAQAAALLATTVLPGFVNSTATISALPSGWSVAKPGTGLYNITHNLGLSTPDQDLIMVVTANGATGSTGVVTATAANIISVQMSNAAGTPTDIGFNFIAYKRA